MSSYELAQFNIARMKAPLESPAMADFVANLENSNYFARPVEIVDSQVEGATQERPTDLIKFTVKAKFVQPRT